MPSKTSGLQDILKGVLKYQSSLKKEIFKRNETATKDISSVGRDHG